MEQNHSHSKDDSPAEVVEPVREPIEAAPGPAPSSPRRSVFLAAGALVILALALDLWGLRWGLPDARHIRSYHPDEWTVLEAAQRVDLFHGRLNPGFYNYGSLYIYAVWAALQVAGLMGIVDPHPALHRFDPHNLAAINLTGRCVTVLFSAATVILIRWLCDRLFGPRTAMIAGVLLVITPLFAIHAHYATVDTPAAFWMAAAVLAATYSPGAPGARMKADQPDNPTIPTVPAPQRIATESTEFATPRKAKRVTIPIGLLISAGCAGLAAGTKYNAGIVITAAWLAWFWNWQISDGSPRAQFVVRRVPDLIYGWVVLSIVAVIALLISTPGMLTDTALWAQEFTYELKHSQSGHGYVFTHTSPAYLYHITHSLWMGMGPPLCILALVGALFALIKRTREDALLAAVCVPYYLIIGTAQIKFMRYAIPLLPFLCVWAARLVMNWRLREQPVTDGGVVHPHAPDAVASRTKRGIALVALLLAAVFALAETVAYDQTLARPDVRDRAEDWILTHVPAHDSIGMPAAPWFDTPPIIPFNMNLSAAEIQRRSGQWSYTLDITGWDAATLQREQPHYFLYSEWQARYLLRLHALEPSGVSDEARAARQAWEFLNTLNREYRLVVVFTSPPRWLGVNFRFGFVPDDWLYPDPVIRIFERRRPGGT